MRSKKLKRTRVAQGAIAGMLCLSLFTSANVAALAATNFTDAMHENNGKYYSDFSSIGELNKASRELNETIAGEGFVLLKNDGTLPLDGVKKVSVFGKSSVNPSYGGAGSGSVDSSQCVSLYDSLHNAGFITNGALESFYKNNELSGPGRTNGWFVDFEINETPIASYTQSVKDSYSKYNDAAIVFITRDGSEGFELTPTKNTNSAAMDYGYDYLEYNKNERDLIKHVKDSGFKKIIVILSMSNAMEVGEIQNDEKINGILLAGQAGINGMNAIGKILKGEINPSGRTVDLWDAVHEYDPTWQNFATNAQANATSSNPGGTVTNKYQYQNAEGNWVSWSRNSFEEYEEDIYIGYRYYETAATVDGYDFSRGNERGGWDYDDAVVYPFGYGLSYTDFSWEIVSEKPTTLTKDSDIEVRVKVTNEGSVAGKDVVQLYYSAPYYEGIEKAHVNLGAFAKTELIQPGDYDIVTLTMKAQDMASFDYSDANDNDFRGYELEHGEYNFYVSQNSHSWANIDDGLKFTASLEEDQEYTKNIYTGNDVEVLFSNNDVYNSMPNYANQTNGKQDYSGYEAYSWGKMHLMSRSDFEGTYPTTPVASEYQLTAAAAGAPQANYDPTNPGQLKMRHIFIPADDTGTAQSPSFYAFEGETNAPWYLETAPSTWTQYDAERDGERPAAPFTFAQIAGLDYDDDAAWEAILNAFTWQELTALVGNGGYRNIALDYIGKTEAIDQDGPAQIKGSGGGVNNANANSIAWVCEAVISCTWNIELAYEQGRMVGNEGLWIGTVGWYAPAMNTHRSPYSARNFEYYSSDGIQGGYMAAATVRGVQSKGVYAYIKHFALNDNETDRYGLSVNVSEQAMREIYLKQFELAVTLGGANALMTAHNHIGNIPNHGNYVLLTKLLREEWGFKGLCVTDSGSGSPTDQKNNPNLRIRTGLSLCLGNGTNGVPQGSYDAEHNRVTVPVNGPYGEALGTTEVVSATTWAGVRESAKQILYTTANSANQLNGFDFSALGGELEAAVVGEEISVTLASVKGGAVKYTVVGGSLPAGLTLTEDGLLTGTPALAGEYTVTVRAQAVAEGEQWIKKTATYTIKVDDNGAVSAEIAAGDAALKEQLDAANQTIKDQNEQIGQLQANLDALKADVEAKHADTGCGGTVESMVITGAVLGTLAMAMAVIAIVRRKNGKAE